MTDRRQEVSLHYEGVSKLDLNVARLFVSLYFESLELHQLTTEQEVEKLWKENELSNQEMEEFPRKEYLYFAGCENQHFNAYFSHFIFDNCDEEQLLLKGNIVSEKNHRTGKLFKESKSKLPPFPYRSFIKSHWNIIFYLLDQRPPKTSKADYYKMKTWQILRKIDCVNLLLDQFIERFNKLAGKEGCHADFVRSELKAVNELQHAHQYTPGQFIAKLIQLKAIDEDMLPDNETEFHQLYCKFLKGHSFSSILTPQMLRTSLRQVRSGKLSPLPMLGWTLIKYKKWLTLLLEGKIDSRQSPGISCLQLYDQTYEQGIGKSEILIAEFKQQYPQGGMSEKKYKAVILAEINKYRLKYNNLQYKDYFLYLPGKKILKSYFINNCFLDIDLEKHISELSTSVTIYQMARFFKAELFQIDESLANPFRNILELKNKLADLITLMVPNSEVMGQLWRLYKKTSVAISAHKPYIFIVEDLKEDIKTIFNKAYDNLNRLLYQKPGHLIAYYAIQQIRDLELRVLNAQDNDLNLNEYFDKVKNVFKIHLEYVKNMDHQNPFNPNIHAGKSRKSKESSDNSKPMAFHYQNIKDDKLLLVLKALIKLNAIPANTTLPQLRRLFNGQEVTDPMEWWADLGDLMAFIKEAIRVNGPDFCPYNQHWKITAKCFVQKGGEEFSPQKLRCSKPTALENEFIEAAGQFK